MSKLYIITGPAGVGKSTVSYSLADSLKKSVLLEGDDIYHQVIGGYVPAWKEQNHLDVFWKVCIKTIEIYLETGYDVIFNYIIMKEKFYELQKIFKNFETKFIVLLVNEETILKRDQERLEDCQMKERCIILLNEFVAENYPSNYILYTDKLSVQDVTEKIISEKRFSIKEK